MPDEDLAADMYEFTNDACQTHGLGQYEISNYAAPEMESQHNLIYWNGGDYIGIGPGAHGRLTLDGTRFATETTLAPAAWLNRVVAQNSGTSQSNILSPEDRTNEMLLMGLRITEGISLTRVADILGHPLKVSQNLIELGFVSIKNDILTATTKGRPLLNQIVQELMV